VKKDKRLINNNSFTEQWFELRGYTKNEDGSYSPPKFKSKTFSPSEEVIVKEKVVETPDFEYKPITEWFIGLNVPSKKNSRQNFVRNGKQISIPSKIHQEYVNGTKAYWIAFGKEFARTVAVLNLHYPLRVEFTFIRSSRRRFDYCNAAQTCEDLMTTHNWIEDDSADHLIPVFNQYQYDKENPGVKIKLLTNK